jgi:DNA polymerase (family 10)
MKSNSDIARLFNLYAELLLLHGLDEKLSHLLSGAAYRIRRIEEPLTEFLRPELVKLFRPQVAGLIEELKSTGTIESLDELVQLTPSGLFDMMRIKGLGGKKLSILWKTAKLDNIEDLLKACKAGELESIKGFGAKTQANIINAIENLNAGTDRFHFADVADVAEDLVSGLQKILKTKLVSLCGEIRRQTLTVHEIEIIAAVPHTKFTTSSLKRILHINASSRKITKGHTLDEIPVTVYHTTVKAYHTELFTLTGNDAHVKKVLAKIKTNTAFDSEVSIYKKAKLPFIVPEMREDVAEWDFIKDKNAILIDNEDIRGVVHNHTTYSDGVDKLEAFVNACIKRGYEYTVISDHSKNAHYAGGLKEEKVLRQFAEIEALNKKVAPFKIFKSIECDILVSGELDYDTSLLKKFDLVIASVHQLLKMDEKRATARLIKAIENPYTTILGHMTGRQLLIRPGYPVDFIKVIDACAANGVVIEINTNPYRLDMDWSHLPYALQKGVMISLNPDAHSIGEIENIRWGVSAARKGGLTKEMTWNAMPLSKILSWLKKKKSRR